MAGLGPQAFYEDVIDPAALTIHTNVDIVVFECLSKLLLLLSGDCFTHQSRNFTYPLVLISGATSS